jgi:hypothetical protein
LCIEAPESIHLLPENAPCFDVLNISRMIIVPLMCSLIFSYPAPEDLVHIGEVFEAPSSARCDRYRDIAVSADFARSRYRSPECRIEAHFGQRATLRVKPGSQRDRRCARGPSCIRFFRHGESLGDRYRGSWGRRI